MSSTLAAPAESTQGQLEIYALRDDLVGSYAPVNAHEHMLVSQIARAWLRLQRAQDGEQRFFAKQDMAEVIATDLDKFKAVTRYTSECERAWRHAVAILERTQRRRLAADLASPRRNGNPNFRPTPVKPATPVDGRETKSQMKRPRIAALAGSEAHPLSNAPDGPFVRELRLPPEVL